MELLSSVYIPSIDAKDLCSNAFNNKEVGYSVRTKTGEFNTNRFINSLAASIDLNKLEEIYYRVNRKRGFRQRIGSHDYSNQVINVTFKYAIKDFNNACFNTYVKWGYSYNELTFNDCIALDGEKVVGVQVNTPVGTPIDSALLGKQFSCIEGEYKVGTLSTVTSANDLRKQLYEDGFMCDGIHYVRLKRSSGSARVGKCLFVNEELYSRFNRWQKWKLTVNEGDPIDLAAYESYISLTTSSIIDFLEIDPKSILVIDDYDSVFMDTAVATKAKDGRYYTEQVDTEVSNSIWDGQSLIDVSLMGKYKSKGMVLLRNGFFKSCCFNTNIQQWFADNNITSIEQLNGFTNATDISQVKLITTPNSIKYLKFGKVEQWLKVIDTSFGVVKYDKKTHYFEGQLVRTHYQLLSTLQMSYEETQEFMQDSLDFLDRLHDDASVLRYFIKYPFLRQKYNEELMQEELEYTSELEEYNKDEIKGWGGKNEVIFNLLGINDKFAQTKYFKQFKDNLINSLRSHYKRGHIFVHGNYSTLLGNPIEMLKQSIGQFNGESELGIGNIRCSNFDYDRDILGSRSPHVAFGNILVAHNVDSEDIKKYINTTDEIVCVNSIGENLLERLSGAD